MKKFVLFLLLLFLCIERVQAYDLLLNPQIVSSQEKICFRDLGRLRGKINDPQTQKLWQEKCFMNLPTQETVLTKSDVEIYLWKGGFFPQQINGERVVIKPKLAQISFEKIEQTLNGFFSAPEYRVEIKNKKELLLPASLKGSFALDGKKNLTGQRKLYIQNSQKENIAQVEFVLYRQKFSYVTKKRISKGETLSSANMEKKYFYSKDNRIKNAINLLGYVATSDLPSGQTIQKNDTQRPPIVSVGSIVRVSYRNKQIAFTMYAKTKESGYPGEKIKVQKIDGGRIIYAYLTGAETAELRNEASDE